MPLSPGGTGRSCSYGWWDLDQLIDGLAHHPVGRPLVWVMAAGFVVFALYSLVEVRYREVHAGD